MGEDITPLGIPFNFHGVLDVVLIPRTIASDRDLSPGARLLWGVIRQRAWKDGWCRSSDSELASDLGVLARQVRKYLAQLTRAGLLLTRQRPGSTPERALLLTDRFKVRMAGTNEVVLPIKPPGAGGYARSSPIPRYKRTAPPVQKDRPPGPKGPPYIRKGGSSEGSSEGGGFSTQEQNSAMKTGAPEACAGSAPGLDGQTASPTKSRLRHTRAPLADMEAALNLHGRFPISFTEAVELVQIHKDPLERDAAAKLLARGREYHTSTPGKSST